MRAESGDIVDAFGIELPVWTLWAATGAVGLLLLSIASRRVQQAEQRRVMPYVPTQYR